MYIRVCVCENSDFERKLKSGSRVDLSHVQHNTTLLTEVFYLLILLSRGARKTGEEFAINRARSMYGCIKRVTGRGDRHGSVRYTTASTNNTDGL